MTYDQMESKGWSVAAITLAAVSAIVISLLCGCVYKGAKVTEGTNLAMGITIPSTDGVAQLNALDYVSGFRLGVAENAALKVKYTVAETNEWLWGAAETRVFKSIDAKVEPCEVTVEEVAKEDPE